MRHMQIVAALVVTLICGALPAAGTDGQEAPVGNCDIAPFGVPVPQEGSANPQPQVRWAEPRKVRQVVAEFAGGQPSPDPCGVSLQYWQRTWDGQADPVLMERGAGWVGWDAMDDWTNGKWITAKTSLQVDGKRWTFTILPITSEEIKDIKGPGVSYRKTLWVRLNSPKPLPACEKMQVFTESSYRPLSLRIHFGQPAALGMKPNAEESIQIEVYNGRLVNVRAEGADPFTIGTSGIVKLAAGATGVLLAELSTAKDPMDATYDRTIVTVRSNRRPFSFAADEIRGDRILVDDLGVLVTNAEDRITLEQYRQALRTNFTGKTVYQRVKESPEQTLERAWGDMPLKRPLFFVHGLPGDRNSMRQLPNGEIEVTSVGRWFDVQPTRSDSKRKQWKTDQLRISLGLPDDTLRGGRRLEDGYLPLLYTWWQDGPIYYEQASVLDALDSDLNDIRLDDPTVLLVRVRIVNASDKTTGTGKLRLTSASDIEDKLIVQQGQALAQAVTAPGCGSLSKAPERGPLRPTATP